MVRGGLPEVAGREVGAGEDMADGGGAAPAAELQEAGGQEEKEEGRAQMEDDGARVDDARGEGPDVVRRGDGRQPGQDAVEGGRQLEEPRREEERQQGERGRGGGQRTRREQGAEQPHRQESGPDQEEPERERRRVQRRQRGGRGGGAEEQRKEEEGEEQQDVEGDGGEVFCGDDVGFRDRRGEKEVEGARAPLFREEVHGEEGGRQEDRQPEQRGGLAPVDRREAERLRRRRGRQGRHPHPEGQPHRRQEEEADDRGDGRPEVGQKFAAG